MTRKGQYAAEPGNTQKLVETASQPNRQLHRINRSRKLGPERRTIEEGDGTGQDEAARGYWRKRVSSREQIQQELGRLVLSLVKSGSDDERQQCLRFLNSTLRRYIELGQ